MRKELVIVGLALVAVGIALMIVGYGELRPTNAEKTAAFVKGLTESVTGEKAPDVPQRDRTGPAVMTVLGAVLFVGGLTVVLRSGKRQAPCVRIRSGGCCQNCGAELTEGARFCRSCGARVG